MIERWFRSLKEECVWQLQFHSFADAKAAIGHWIAWYNEERPHQALGYRSPRQYQRQGEESVWSGQGEWVVPCATESTVPRIPLN